MNVLDSSGLIDILYQWLGGLGGSVIFILTVCLVTSFLVAELFHRLRLPRIVGQIVAGIILGFPLWRDLLFTGDVVGYISILSELGIIFLLLLAGLEIDYVKLRKASKDIALVAVFSAVVPFILGFMVMKFLGYGDIPALIIGAALSITAEGTKTAVLTEFNVLKTRLGTIMLGAGALDDIFEIIFIAAVIALAHGSGILEIILFPLKLALFFLLSFLMFKILPMILRYVQKEKTEINMFTTTVIFALVIALFSESLDLSPIVGALIAGLIIQVSIKDKIYLREIVENLKMITFGLIVPFFFIFIGLHFDVQAIFLDPILLLLILIVATAGKILGSMILTFFSRFNLRQATLIGWGMNSRGTTELIIAEIARSSGLIPIEVFSAVVIMAILTTLAFPIVLKHEIERYPLIME